MELSQILPAVCVIAGILLLKPIVNTIPSLIGCLARWKECVNLENSMKLRRERNIFAVFLIVPFCLVAARYHLYSPGFTEGLSPEGNLGVTAGAFFCYLLFRAAMAWSAGRPKGNEKIYDAARNCPASFFCIMVPVILSVAGICSFSDISENFTRQLILYSILVLFIVSVIRKFQILRNCCSFLTSILYLCALEILPAGILILSAVLL